MSQTLLRIRQVQELTGLSRSAVYKQMGLGNFPKSIVLAGTAVAWIKTEIEDWVQSRITERDDQEAQS